MTEQMLPTHRLRVALVAGTLTRGGAEKQLFYMVRALVEAGVDVRVCSLRRGEFFEAELQRIGIPPIWTGRNAHPVLRTIELVRALANFRPHIVQSAHFYTNLYVTTAALVYGAVGIGALRSNAHYEVSANGGWGRWLLRLPPALIANSQAAKSNAESLGIRPEKVYVVPNVIDLTAFDRAAEQGETLALASGRVVVVSVATHIAVKRLERFLAAVARARVEVPALLGLLIGAGPEGDRLRAVAQALGLSSQDISFLGARDDVPRQLRGADLLLLTSDAEGFPNAILEAMAAKLPVITTPAGDAGLVVKDDVTGYVVPFDDVEQIAERVVRLARSPELRRSFGRAGRLRVEQCYSSEQLAASLLGIYRNIAAARSHEGLLRLIPRCG
jgi:glycosyltransferase involved in cell wall biosynthesis